MRRRDRGEWQALQIERVGSEAAHGRGGAAAETSRLVQHGDHVVLRAHTGRLLQLATATEPGQHPGLVASATRHSDAQHWEIWLA